MNYRPTTVERAYELARSGEYGGVSEIKARLRAEGLRDVEGQLYGRSIGTDLRRLCTEAQASRAATQDVAEA
jgi:hypothetical protein